MSMTTEEYDREEHLAADGIDSGICEDCVADGGTMKGILFKPETNLAIREGRKTQTRRLVKANIAFGRGGIVLDLDDGLREIKPKYRVGEIVYVKEGWRAADEPDRPQESLSRAGYGGRIEYRSDHTESRFGWLNAQAMPEWASRIKLKITAVRSERLQEISEEDAKAEGIEQATPGNITLYRDYSGKDAVFGSSPIVSYRSLWDSINKPPNDWDANPIVWVYSFEKVMEERV